MTNSISEIINADVIFVTGSNTTETHPVVGARIRRAKARGAKLIVADPRRIDLAKDADVYLQIKPGTNLALFNSLMHVIISEGLQDKAYIASETENYDHLEELVARYAPEVAAEICGVAAEDIRKAARIYAAGPKAGIFYAMGVTQHKYGTYGVMAVSNLALLCGNIGVESAGVNPLRGQNNVQGACDVGGLPADYPGYQKVYDAASHAKFEAAWGVPLSDQAGLTIPEMMSGASAGTVKMLYIMGENPMISDPDLNHVTESLNKLDFLVVQDIFLTETAQLADVVLPAAAFAEKNGTFTNTERRIQLVRKAIDAPGDAKADWQILMEVMNAIGYPCDYPNAESIMTEIAAVTPQYGGVTYDRLVEEGLQWPCPNVDHPGTPYLHKGGIVRGKGLFVPQPYIESEEVTTAEYPLIMTTGRNLYHYHTRTMTGKSAGINAKSPSSYIEINPTTANKLGIKDGDRVQVASQQGQIETRAYLTDIVGEGTVFIPFHFSDGGAVNYLTNNHLDSIAKIPELKVNAVRVWKADQQ